MWPWDVKMATQNLLRFLLFLMLILRIMLATVCWFGSWRLVIKLNFCSDFEHKVGQDFKFKFSWNSDAWVKFWSLFNRDSENEIWSRFVFELVIWAQPSGPLCLWQCFDIELKSAQTILATGLYISPNCLPFWADPGLCSPCTYVMIFSTAPSPSYSMCKKVRATYKI